MTKAPNPVNYGGFPYFNQKLDLQALESFIFLLNSRISLHLISQNGLVKS